MIAEMMRGPALHVTGMSKRFGSTVALDRVDFSAERGTVNAIIGENGAGKSTLMHCLFGLVHPDSGGISLDGEPLPAGHSPAESIERGIGMLQQHVSLVPVFSVLDNIILGQEPGGGLPMDRRKAEQHIRKIFERLGIEIDPQARADSLTVAQAQMVEIARMLYAGARMMIFDEPTAALAPQEIDRLYGVIHELAGQGATIILITHRLAEVLTHCDRATVLRRGRVTGVFERSDMSEAALIAAMIAEHQATADIQPPPFDNTAAPALELRDLTCLKEDGSVALQAVNLSIHPGEIIGCAGVTGAGQQALAETIIGLRPAGSGSITMNGKDISALSTARRRDAGMVYVPEDRFSAGVIAPFTLVHNRLLGEHRRRGFRSGGGYRLPLLRDDVKAKIRRYDISAPGPTAVMQTLSGGNQQKLMLARELERNPQVVVAHGPTRGLDFAASARLYRILLQRAEEGAAVLLMSGELEDLLHYTHRVIVLYGNRILHAGLTRELDARSIGLLMTRGEAAP